MWTRKEIKTEAKGFLKRHYLKSFLVCLILSILVGGAGGNSKNTNNQNDIRNNEYYQEFQENIPEGVVGDSIEDTVTTVVPRKFGISALPSRVLGFTFIAMVVGILVGMFFTNVLEVGANKFFLDGFAGNPKIGDMFSIFSQSNYLNMVVTQFKRNVFIMLWSLLFLIPGIIKAYQYKMIPFILADSPELDSAQVFERSKALTKGNKFDIFMLDVSFIGWYIIGSLAFGVGVLFVNPYVRASYAKLYEKLKIEKGFAIEGVIEEI